jgi:hypothetical protein
MRKGFKDSILISAVTTVRVMGSRLWGKQRRARQRRNLAGLSETAPCGLGQWPFRVNLFNGGKVSNGGKAGAVWAWPMARKDEVPFGLRPKPNIEQR